MVVLGTKYRIGAVIHTGFDEFFPLFRIKKIYILSSSIRIVYFKMDPLHTQKFCTDYGTYIVKRLIHTAKTGVLEQHAARVLF